MRLLALSLTGRTIRRRTRDLSSGLAALLAFSLSACGSDSTRTNALRANANEQEIR